MTSYSPFVEPHGPLWAGEWVKWVQELERNSRAVLLPTLPTISGACLQCSGAGVVGNIPSLCWHCASLTTGDPLKTLLLISYSFRDGLESLVATTKRNGYSGTSWQRKPMAALYFKWFEKHMDCINKTGEEFLITRVPSSIEASDHLRKVWDEYPMLQTQFPLDCEAISRATTTKPKRGSIEPEHYAVSKNVRGRNIVLVDDIFTSGASMRSAAMKLKSEGARAVIGVALGRTLNDESRYGNNLLIARLAARRKWSLDVCRLCIGK